MLFTALDLARDCVHLPGKFHRDKDSYTYIFSGILLGSQIGKTESLTFDRIDYTESTNDKVTQISPLNDRAPQRCFFVFTSR